MGNKITFLTNKDKEELEQDISQLSGEIENLEKEVSDSVKLPITLGMFFYSNLINLEGDTVEEKAQNLARYDVVVYQGSLSNDLTMSTQSYVNDLKIYQRAMEINPELKMFGYVTARGFGYVQGTSTSKGMTEYRVSPEGIDHPIWTKEELFAYMNLMAHCGGTRTSESNEYGNSVLTGGIPLYGVFYDDYDYNYNNQNEHLINQGDWASVREKQNSLIDYAHSIGLSVMPNSSPNYAFSYDATDSYFNPNGEYSHMNENDWFCLESYFLRSDNTFDVNISYASDYIEKYKNIYRSKMLALPYIYAVSGDDENNKKVASTFALYQALCQGVDCIALFGSDLFTEIPEEFSKYYDHNGTAVYTADNKVGKYTLSVNGHTITTTRNLVKTRYGELPDADALASCIVTVDKQYTFNNMYVRSEVIVRDLQKTKDEVSKEIEELENLVVEGSNLYHRAFIDDWVAKYGVDDYTNKCFTFRNAEGGEGATSSWDNTRPYDVRISLPNNASWLRAETEFSEYAGKTLEIGFDSCEAYAENNPDTKISITWQVNARCESNSWMTLATVKSDDLVESIIDGVKRCCVKFTVPEDIISFVFWCQRGSNSPTGTWIVDAKGMYMVDPEEFAHKKTWYTNHLPSISEWRTFTNYGNTSYTVDEDGDGVTIDFSAIGDYTCAETGIVIPANPNIMKAGEIWEFGIKEFYAYDDDGNDVTNKAQFFFGGDGTFPCSFNLYGKSKSFYTSEKSELSDALYKLSRVTIPDDYTAGLPSTQLFVKMLGFNGGEYRDDGTPNYYHIRLKGVYFYNVDERDELYIRGEDPSATYIQICRVTEEKLALDTKLQRNALYITDAGNLFITDHSGNRIDIIDKG